MKEKVTIPGIMFIIVPIILWVLYANYDSFLLELQTIYKEAGIAGIIAIFIMINICLLLIEFLIRIFTETLPEKPIDFLSLISIKVPYKLVQLINKHLTIKI